MRLRTGIVVGAAFGYVLGARAGRGRYEQIKSLALQARKHPAVAQLADQGGGLIDAGRYALAASLSAGSKGLRALENRGESG
jgi:hypothetical protein